MNDTPTRDQVQAEAIEAIVGERRRGVRSTLLQMPTQVGKTRVACRLMARGIEEWGGRFLVLAHMGELLDQFGRELDVMGIRHVREQASSHSLEWMRLDPRIRVCLGSKDTLRNRGKSMRLARWPQDWFTDLIEDEAHLATSTTWRTVHAHFDSAFRLGMTATVDRADGVPLSRVFDSVAYQYPIDAAIRNGHRVPFRVIPCETDIDIRGIRADTLGELDPAVLAARIGPKLADLANVVRMRFEDLQTRGVARAIAFLPTVPLALLFAELLTGIGVPARSVHGDDPARVSKVREHREGRYPVLVNQKLLGMGYNDPAIGAVIDLSPTKSRAWLDQKAGRCGATAPGKEFGYLLYAGWECDPDLVGPTDIFAVNMSEKVRTAARRLMRAAKDADPRAVVDRAKEIVEREEARERWEAGRKARLKVERRDVRHRYREYDPIGVVRRHGLPPDESDRFWADRRACGMSTYKQFQLLTRVRHDPSRVLAMTAGEAGRVIDELRRGVFAR